MSRLVYTLHLIRAWNCLLASAGIWIGARLTWSEPVYYGPTVASLAAFLICAAGNVMNDMVDVEGDRTNHPERVLVTGELSLKYARNLVLVLSIVALIMAVAISLAMLAIALATMGLLAAYNLRLKRMPVAGNTVVAMLAGMTFLTGGIAVDATLAFRLPGPLVAAVFAFLFHLVRELVKDVQDIDGDRRVGLDSLPLRLGVSKSLWLALALFVVMAATTLLPVLFGWYSRAYEIIVIFLVDLPLLVLMMAVCRKPSRRLLSVASAALKIGMAMGLVALVVA